MFAWHVLDSKPYLAVYTWKTEAWGLVFFHGVRGVSAYYMEVFFLVPEMQYRMFGVGL